tara:strand:- start:3712 stop:3819 length:108 start_codon:yes stop_codon:yes gene_type:complete
MVYMRQGQLPVLHHGMGFSVPDVRSLLEKVLGKAL